MQCNLLDVIADVEISGQFANAYDRASGRHSLERPTPREVTAADGMDQATFLILLFGDKLRQAKFQVGHAPQAAADLDKRVTALRNHLAVMWPRTDIHDCGDAADVLYACIAHQARSRLPGAVSTAHDIRRSILQWLFDTPDNGQVRVLRSIT